MTTIVGGAPRRDAALAMIAQVERQAGAIARRAARDETILDRFIDFRSFIDQLAEFHLFIDMVENRLGAFDPETREAQIRKLSLLRWSAMEAETEICSRFLDRMVTGQKPWPMGSQKFLRRRLSRLDEIAAFHAAHGAGYELVPPNAGLMQNIRARIETQIDSSMPLADFGTAPAPDAAPPPVVAEPPPEEPVVDDPPQAAAPGPGLPPLPTPVSPSAPAEPPPLADQLPPVPEGYGEDYVSPKAKAVDKLVEKPGARPGVKPAANKPAAPGMARRDFRLKVRDDADGYHYIEGNGLAVITEACRIANTTIDELARNLELSRPGLVLILNGRDPVGTDLLKTLRRFVLRTGGLVYA